MILGVTGHRPPDLGGYSTEALILLLEIAKEQLANLRPSLVISGMALGWDQACAMAAIHLDIPFHAYIPFKGQHKAWPKKAQKLYQGLAGFASGVKYFGDHYDLSCMRDRNQGIIDDSEKLLANYNGYIYSGTADAIERAETKKMEIINVYGKWKERATQAGLVDA